MKGTSLTFYTYELEKNYGILMHEWLLEFAKKHGITGGSCFRAIAGYGRHQMMHEEHFFELASNVPVETVFILNEKKATEFLELLKKEELDLFYIKTPIEYDTLNNDD